MPFSLLLICKSAGVLALGAHIYQVHKTSMETLRDIQYDFIDVGV